MRERGRKGGREGGRKEGRREGGKEGGKERGREGAALHKSQLGYMRLHQNWLAKCTGRQMIPWCSGYHVSLTHSRSPVRSRVESLFVNFFSLLPFFLSAFLFSFFFSPFLSVSPLPSHFSSFPFLSLPRHSLQKTYRYGCELKEVSANSRQLGSC